jgi:hypothetical protein
MTAVAAAAAAAGGGSGRSGGPAVRVSRGSCQSSLLL